MKTKKFLTKGFEAFYTKKNVVNLILNLSIANRIKYSYYVHRFVTERYI